MAPGNTENAVLTVLEEDRQTHHAVHRAIGFGHTGARPTHLVEASDDFSFPDVPDERSVTGRRPRDAVQVSFTEKQTRHQFIYTTQ